MAAEEAETKLASPQFEKHYKAVQHAVPQEDEKGKRKSDSPQPFINKLRKHQNSFADCLLSCIKIGAKNKIYQIQSQACTKHTFLMLPRNPASLKQMLDAAHTVD